VSNSTTIQCITPPSNGLSEKTVKITVLLNGRRYTSDELSFQYQSNSSLNKDEEEPLMYILPGAAVVLCAIFGALLCIAKRRRNKGAPSKFLLEPDYPSLVFSGTVPPYEIDTKRQNQLMELEEMLLEMDFSLVTLLCDVTQVADMDQVARCLLYIYESRNHSIDLLKYFITRDVQNAGNIIL
jgi:hypothetical protein